MALLFAQEAAEGLEARGSIGERVRGDGLLAVASANERIGYDLGGGQRGGEIRGQLGTEASQEGGRRFRRRAPPAGPGEGLRQLAVAERQDGSRITAAGAGSGLAPLQQVGPPELEAGPGGRAEEEEREAQGEQGREAAAQHAPPELARRPRHLTGEVGGRGGGGRLGVEGHPAIT